MDEDEQEQAISRTKPPDEDCVTNARPTDSSLATDTALAITSCPDDPKTITKAKRALSKTHAPPSLTGARHEREAKDLCLHGDVDAGGQQEVETDCLKFPPSLSHLRRSPRALSSSLPQEDGGGGGSSTSEEVFSSGSIEDGDVWRRGRGTMKVKLQRSSLRTGFRRQGAKLKVPCAL